MPRISFMSSKSIDLTSQLLTPVEKPQVPQTQSM